MKIEKVTKPIFCFCCKKKFDDGFEVDFDKRFFNNVKFCKRCAEDFYKNLAVLFTPKSPKNVCRNLKILE